VTEISTLLHQFIEANARKVPNAFEQFLDKEINIGKGMRSLASTSQNALREFLATEHSRDSSFPRVLSLVDSDFLGGSFARHTKIWPLDDIDVYLPLDGCDLFYLRYGQRLPYTVLSDGVLTGNPLLLQRWMEGIYISPRKIINEFAAALRRHYPKETAVYPDGEAVAVRMSQGSSGSGDGLGYDVVPCFSLKPDDTNELAFYLIPDGSNGWIHTNPKVDTMIADTLHRNNDETYRKVVKLLKYWNATKLSGAIASYYIELAVAKVYREKNSKAERVTPLSFGVALGLWALGEALKKGTQLPWITGAPVVESGAIDAFGRIMLQSAVSESHLAWDLERAGKSFEAVQAWKKVFGSSFGTE